MENLARKFFSESEYLDQERLAEHKSEYYKGEIFAMAGSSYVHNLLVGNTIGLLWQLFKDKPCKVLPSDLRVNVNKNQFYTYPDITIICDKPKFLDNQLDTLLNPIVLFEVLSDSTEKYDRGQKFSFYRSIDSLQEYVLVASKQKKLEKYRRVKEGWLFSESEDDQLFKLDSLDIYLDIEEMYKGIDWTDRD